MKHLPLIRAVSSGLVAALGAIVLIAAYWNVGYFADLGDAARRLGDDGTTGSLLSFAAGALLVVLGAVGVMTSHLEAGPTRSADRMTGGVSGAEPLMGG